MKEINNENEGLINVLFGEKKYQELNAGYLKIVHYSKQTYK